MAWERRGTRFYYYRKVREGKRVFSTYYGDGPSAEAVARADAEARQEREQQRRLLKSERNEIHTIDQAIKRQEETLNAIVGRCLSQAGYHKHCGTWRKRRRG